MFCQGRSDYKTGGIFYGLVIAPKIKYCLTIIEVGINQQHMTFKGFNDSKRLLDRSHFFDMVEVGRHQLCYQDHGKNHFLMASLYL